MWDKFSQFFLETKQEINMPMIKITGVIPDSDHPLSMRESLVDLYVETMEHTVKWLRERNPVLPQVPNTHEVATMDLVEALNRASTDNRTLDYMSYWSQVASTRRVIYIPYNCAVVVLERDASAVTP